MRAIKLLLLAVSLLAGVVLLSMVVGASLVHGGAPEWVGTVAMMVVAFFLAGPCLGIYVFLASTIK